MQDPIMHRTITPTGSGGLLRASVSCRERFRGSPESGELRSPELDFPARVVCCVSNSECLLVSGWLLRVKLSEQWPRAFIVVPSYQNYIIALHWVNSLV